MLGKIERLVKVGWALAVLSFGMGVWATTLQFRVSTAETSITKMQSERDGDQKEFQSWRNSKDSHDASMDTKLDFIVNSLRATPSSR